ncbi:MAG: PadR family transcriptional regulator [Spirochaetota bacterium]|nr:PadR family transcriptional regulator [Spirochaetota bacterium]
MLKFSNIDKFLDELGINDGQLYTTLKKLDSEGLVIKDVVHQEGVPSKHKYSIIEDGKEEFKDWLENFNEEENKIRYNFLRKDALITRCAFIKHMNKKVALRKVRKQIEIT